jgi:hypothetical protein
MAEMRRKMATRIMVSWKRVFSTPRRVRTMELARVPNPPSTRAWARTIMIKVREMMIWTMLR